MKPQHIIALVILGLLITSMVYMLSDALTAKISQDNDRFLDEKYGVRP